MNLSINALIMAMFAIQRDIIRHEKLNNDESVTEEEREDYGQYVLDLTQVFGEFAMAYKEAQQASPEFPLLEELMHKIEQA